MRRFFIYFAKTDEFLPSNLGSENAGKFLAVDSTGSVEFTEGASSAQIAEAVEDYLDEHPVDVTMKSVALPKTIQSLQVGDSYQNAILKLGSTLEAGFTTPTSITDSEKEHWYVKYSDGSYSTPTDTSRSLFTYEVTEGQIFLIDCQPLASTAATIAFYNSATIGTESYMKKFAIAGGTGSNSNFALLVPTGAVRLCVSCVTGGSYRARCSTIGIDFNKYVDLGGGVDINQLVQNSNEGHACYTEIDMDYCPTGDPLTGLTAIDGMYITASRKITSASNLVFKTYYLDASTEDRYIRIDDFINGYSSIPVGGAYLVDSVSDIVAGTTIPVADFLITPATVSQGSSRRVFQSVFVPANRILCVTHSTYNSESYLKLYNTYFGSEVIQNINKDIEELRNDIDQQVQDSLDAKMNIDAIPDAENPLAVIKETAGYTAIFRKMGVIGGSMSSGSHPHQTGTMPAGKLYEYSSLQFMARLCGSEGFNFSTGGMSARSWPTSTSIGGASDLFNNNPCEMYLIQLGNNDLAYYHDHPESGYTLGTITDVAGVDGVFADTYYGKMGEILSQIRTLQPRAYVFLSTFLRGYGSVDPTFDYNQAVRNICEYYSDPENRPEGDELHYYLLDYYTYGKPYQYYYQGIHTGTTRGSHLVATGYLLMGYQFCTYIDWIIKNNMADFNDVAFVGTDCYWTNE